jgi:SAM-dependent methyltransferase
MSDPSGDKAFIGSIPEIYDRFLVPLIFDYYAADLADRLAGRKLVSVLEIAAGTGVVTRRLAERLRPEVAITSTDLNQPMIDQARKTAIARAVEWRQADATKLREDPGSGRRSGRARDVTYTLRSSTRRFFARPSSLSLGATGCASP